MLEISQVEEAKKKALTYFEKAGIVLTEKEKDNIEVADFGLNDLYNTGLQLLVYINTKRCCAKELVLFPRQTCPEHKHPSIGEVLGKEETFRCRWGEVYLYVDEESIDGSSSVITSVERVQSIQAILPKGTEKNYTVWKEIVLKAGEQYTLSPDTLHWFQSGEMGAVISEFSTSSSDELDIFTNPDIVRITKITGGSN